MVNDDKENVHRTPVFRGTPYPATREVLSTIVNNVNRLIPVYSNQKELFKDGLVGEQFQEYVMKEKTYVEVGKIVEYLYVDRVVNGKRQVRRKKPTFVGWSDSLILDRQISELATGSLKTFFNGRVALPLRSKHSDDESSYEDNTWNIVSAASSDDDEVQCDRNDEHGSFNSVPNVSQAGKDLNQFEILTDGKLSEAHYEKDAGVTLTGNFVQSIGEQKILGKKVPEYVLSELEDSIVGYENIQRKCIMYLLSSKELFSNNNLVDGLQKRFVDLIVKANEFVEKELNIQNYKTLFNNSVLNYVSMRRENTGSSNEKVDAGDGLINFSTKKSVCPDNLVTTNDMVEENKSELFRSMESQSKFLSIQEKCLSNDLKTPGDGRFFKVNLDATIPTFDLGEEFKNQEPNPDSSRVPGLAMQKPERDRKIANIFRSPYIDRITNINGKNFSKEETELWEWLHKNEQYPNRVLFKWQNIMCYKIDFQSMKEGEIKMTSALDVWCCYLNYYEELRSPTSPRRLFCYTETTYTQKVQIRRLRILYTYNMISSRNNCCFGMIMDEMKDPSLVPDEDVLRASMQKPKKI
uniref:Uncharacterized protein n=1 Tax=Daucus carota subsp. sativus TaxID=79200 RepID=A0A164YPN4_DAUCS